jgi:hypothetical protein
VALAPVGTLPLVRDPNEGLQSSFRHEQAADAGHAAAAEDSGVNLPVAVLPAVLPVGLGGKPNGRRSERRRLEVA